MKTTVVTINKKSYTLSSLYLGSVKKMNAELQAATKPSDINEIAEKYLMISLRVEHPELSDDFLDDNIVLSELEELFKKVMEVSSLIPKGDNNEGK